ncbi:MAG: DUF6095 family protein [Polaribacter sp.]|jgi:hypothetical protein|nr:DUF6095 family protein [Polaribacter sp.]
MNTNLNLLARGLKYLGILIFLFIASPILLTIGYKALTKFENTPKEYLSYVILFTAGVLMIFTIYFAFKTFRTLLKALFND